MVGFINQYAFNRATIVFLLLGLSTSLFDQALGFIPSLPPTLHSPLQRPPIICSLSKRVTNQDEKSPRLNRVRSLWKGAFGVRPRRPNSRLPLRRQQFRRKLMTVIASLTISSSTLNRVANAEYQGNPILNPSTTMDRSDLMPGAMAGGADTEEQIGIDNNQGTNNKQEQQSKKADALYDDDYEFYEEGYGTDEGDSGGIVDPSSFAFSQDGNSIDSSNVADDSFDNLSNRKQIENTSEGKIILKTVGKVIAPILIICFVRETIRWQWEQKDVEKGIKIIEQQRQEYLKSKEEDDDDNDDDDNPDPDPNNDDDDDDDDEN